jgi:hypothetical protein
MRLEQIALAVQESIPPGAKPLLDVLAIVGWVSALMGALTTVFGLVAAIASAAWGLVRLYETRTVQSLIKRRREKRDAHSDH